MREILKGYLKRLSKGEDLELVRRDFVKDFKEVDATEIIKAEEELMDEGTPVEEIQKLCDVHSALFHRSDLYDGKKELSDHLCKKKGHPLETFTRENVKLEQLIREAQKEIEQKKADSNILDQIREVAIHYAKKGDLLYPHLKVQYNVSGPSDVMWSTDDEIRDELTALSKVKIRDEGWLERYAAVLKRLDEMIYKESNILFPNCAVNFTEDEWKHIYLDAKDYNVCFGVMSSVWQEAEEAADDHTGKTDGDEIVMPGGHLTREQLTALLNTIPLEITFVDEQDKNCYFNDGPKVFKRPGMAIDREVYSCHPPKIEKMVRRIIDDFKNGRKDQVPIWMEKNGRTMQVTYMAVRDKLGNYLGTMELVQDMEFAKEMLKKNE